MWLLHCPPRVPARGPPWTEQNDQGSGPWSPLLLLLLTMGSATQTLSPTLLPGTASPTLHLGDTETAHPCCWARLGGGEEE
jgi:hypothetical protein